MRPVELVISDIDGTLTTSAGIVTPATRAEIRRVTRRGVHFAVATGRPTRWIREALAGLDLVLPAIGSNGAVVEDITSGEVIHSAHLDHSVARQVVLLAREHHPSWVVYDTPEGWVGEVGAGGYVSTIRHFVGTDPLVMVGDLAAEVNETSTIAKIVVHGDATVLMRLDEALQALIGVRVMRFGERYREIVVSGVDKARAAHLLADRLQVSPDRVLAIGDSGNDVELLTWAGTAVAMGNAIPEIKQVADWVTTSNDEDGVAQALAKFVT